MIPHIYLAFVDDWELRGDGSGDPEQLQFRPMQELVSVFSRHGIRGSFNAEVMQQLTFRKYQDDFPELRRLADRWDQLVLETFQQGHDIQLHIHPQWSGAVYDGNKWQLNADWSILNYGRNSASTMISACKDYLERLLRSIQTDYSCISFRAGSWCIAPSDYILSVLAELGIVFDMSIVGGIAYNNRYITLDYTRCQESFLPFYPEMLDARRVATKPQPIICVPTNHFHEGVSSILRRDLRRALGNFPGNQTTDIKADTKANTDANANAVGYTPWTTQCSIPKRALRKVVSYLRGNTYISDIAQLDYDLLRSMMRSIRQRARKVGLRNIPIILENHTKDLRDFSHIERFAADLARAEDVTCITLSELARMLTAGELPIRLG